MLTDNINIGCNLDEACLAANANSVNPDYDFLTVTAPVDPRLPDGGGYAISGFDRHQAGVRRRGRR